MSDNGNHKKRKRVHGIVTKVIPPIHSDAPEKAQINIHEADPLYREVRVDNELVDDRGVKTKLKPGTEVDVVIEAETTDPALRK